MYELVDEFRPGARRAAPIAEQHQRGFAPTPFANIDVNAVGLDFHAFEARLKRFDGADALCAVEVEPHSLNVVRMNTGPTLAAATTTVLADSAAFDDPWRGGTLIHSSRR
jgi:hypothetical protein